MRVRSDASLTVPLPVNTHELECEEEVFDNKACHTRNCEMTAMEYSSSGNNVLSKSTVPIEARKSTGVSIICLVRLFLNVLKGYY